MNWRRPQREGWAGAGIALLLGAGLRLYFVRHQSHVAGDSLVYGDLATNILRHHVYGFTEADKIRSTLIRLPGYPMLLAVCFAVFGVPNYMASLYVQVAMDLATCVLLAALVKRMAGNAAGMWTLWLAMLCPFTANYVAAPLTEVPAMFCAAVVFYGLQRWYERARAGMRGTGWALAMGAALSFAILLRPDRALLAVATVPAMVWMATRRAGEVRRLWADVALVCAVIVLPLAGWTARNWHVFHVVQPLAPRYANDPGEQVNYGFQRWYRTWAIDFKSTVDVYWTFDGSPLLMSDLPRRTFDSEAERVATEKLYAVYNETVVPTPAMDAAFAQIAAERVRANPLRYYVELPVLRMMNMWVRPRTEMLLLPLDWWVLGRAWWRNVVAVAYGGLNLAYLMLAVAGAWRWRRAGWSGYRAVGYSMVGFVLLRCALLLTLDNSEPRYTLDCYPVVLALAGIGCATWWRRRVRA